MRGRHPYAWGRDHPLVVDGVVAAVVAVFGLLTDATGPEEAWMREPDALSVVLTLGATLPVVLRRRHPLACFGVVAAFSLVHLTREYPGAGPFFGLLVGLYAVAAYAGRRPAVYLLTATLLVLGGGFALSEGPFRLAEAVGVLGLFVAAWVLGDSMRVRRAYVAAVEDRATQLERERDARAQRAVLEERSRIARDLHDIVAHSMSVMVVQAGAARRTLARDPARAAEAIGHIESTGRGALAEMRRLVGVLRDGAERAGPTGDGASRLPQPGLDQVSGLLERCREAGLDVVFRVDGPERPLPSGVELVLYRIVQEALANAMQHAGPARVEVELRYGDGDVSLTVADDGRGAAPADAGREAAQGHGLTGMRERVALYGGDIAIGPRPGGGFRIRAAIPLATMPEPIP